MGTASKDRFVVLLLQLKGLAKKEFWQKWVGLRFLGQDFFVCLSLFKSSRQTKK
jgi:hypothetical protein